MELKYIWIDEYNVIENLGFNFNHSDKHRFNFTGDIIELLPNKKLPIAFGPNITGVTAIAGENGCGKSSLCEAILSSTATYTNGAFGFHRAFKGIVCYGDHIFIYEGLTVKNKISLKKSGYKVIIFKDSPFEDMKTEWRNSFVKGGFIYYSNILDFRTDIDETNLANISTLESLTKSFYYSTSYAKLPLFSEQVYENRDKDKHGPLQIHYNVEGNRIAKFYLNQFKFIPFINVRHFVIKNTYSGNNRWLDLEKINDAQNEEGFYMRLNGIEDIQNEVLNIVFDTSKKFDENTRVKIKAELFKKAIRHLYRYNLINVLSNINKTLPEYIAVYDFVFSSKIGNIAQPKEDINRILFLYDSIVEKSTVLDNNEFYPQSLKNYFKDVKDWRFYLIENCYLSNDAENRALLLEFINLERKLLKGDAPYRRITNLNVTPLSSGENSLLTFFARIHDVVERYSSGVYEKEKLILFIDEAEIGFHPAWKRIFFKKLIDFLNDSITGFKFQVILTTHSPYLLSDLPAENILLLKKGSTGKSVLLNSQEFKTFGSNVHELLANSFFLSDGFMGEFAKEKIEQLIGFLNKKNELFTKESANELILLIGDEIIATRLLDMYNDRFDDVVPNDDKGYETWLLTELKRVQLKKE